MESTIIESAKRYAAMGLSGHWLRSPEANGNGAGKAPIEKGWQTTPYQTPDRLAEKYSPGANLGIRTGMVEGASVGLVVVDLDSADAIEWAKENLPTTPIRTVTGRGEHWFYRHPGTGPIRNGVKLRGRAIDVRGDGGQVVAPGSIHPQTRRPYREAEPWSTAALAEIPTFDRAWLAEQNPADETKSATAQTALAKAAKRVASASRGMRNDTLNKEAFRIARYVGSGELDAETVKEELTAAACQAGLSSDEIATILRNTETGALTAGQRKAKRTPTRRASVTNRLLALVDQLDAELFMSDGTPLARVKVAGHWETLSLRNGDFERRLRGLFFKAEAIVPKTFELADAVALLCARAEASGENRSVFLRIGRTERALYLDLGDPTWRAVEIDETGWRIIAEAPVCFRRSRAMRPLPPPISGGRIDELFKFVNVPEDSRPLLLGWLVACFRPGYPLPLLALSGEQGCGKTWLTKCLRMLVDPHCAEVRGTPRDDRTVMIAAQHAWLLTFDNLSGVPGWLSDVLCCLSSGSAYSSRTLFTDDGETILKALRPTILNGIEELPTRADLLDRCVLLSLPTIPDRARLTEEDLQKGFEAERPRLLGALLDAIACALRRQSEIKLAAKPRMADFALWATAAEPSLGLPIGGFCEAYRAGILAAADLPLESSPIVAPLRALLDQQGRSASGEVCWAGSATELATALQRLALTDVAKLPDWPRNAAALSGVLKRLAPNLRQKGIFVEHGKSSDRKRTRVITIRSLGNAA